MQVLRLGRTGNLRSPPSFHGSLRSSSRPLRRLLNVHERQSNLRLFHSSFSTMLRDEAKVIAIVGGGAAGLMCALSAQQAAIQQYMRSEQKTLPKQKINIFLLERKEQCGRKILMSGGTRCNIMPHISKWPTELLTDEDWAKAAQQNIVEDNKSGAAAHHVAQSAFVPFSNRFFSQQPELLKRILRHWPIVDQKQFFERELGIGLSLEVDTGKYFPKSNDARQVVEAFLSKIKSNNQRYSDFVNVTIINNANVDALDRIDTSTGYKNRNSSWNIRYRRDESSDISKLKYSYNKNLAVQELKCDRLVIASGGLSVINKDGAGIQLLYKLGHRIIPLYPALTPLLSHSDVKPLHKELSGLSSQRVKIAAVWLSDPESLEKGDMIHRLVDANAFLFTHRGYSGPAALNISHHTIIGGSKLDHVTQATSGDTGKNHQVSVVVDEQNDSVDRLMYHQSVAESSTHQKKLFIEVNWTPDITYQDWDHLFTVARNKGSKQQVRNFVHKHSNNNFLPSRLIQLLFDSNQEKLGDQIVCQLTKDQKQKIINRMVRYRIPISGNEGLKKAEVTGGGVDLRDVDTETLKSNVQPNLYICGEALDAFGCIGGFNFSIAWVTGSIAGHSSVVD